MPKLLNIDANPKTVKGQERGYMTAILYLSPYTLSGANVCPTAEIAGCWRTCLNVAGHGGIPTNGYTNFGSGVAHLVPDNAVQRARLERTRLYHSDPQSFMCQLAEEIASFVRKAERKGLTPCVRLNGTSDILWERQTWAPLIPNIMTLFPGLQFYDYTKLPKRLYGTLPANYHLSLSWSGKSPRYQHAVEGIARLTGAPLVVVHKPGNVWDAFKNPQVRALMDRAGCTQVIDGDSHDLRFTDPPHSLVLLKAKGLARRESNGFVLREPILTDPDRDGDERLRVTQ